MGCHLEVAHDDHQPTLERERERGSEREGGGRGGREGGRERDTERERQDFFFFGKYQQGVARGIEGWRDGGGKPSLLRRGLKEESLKEA